jgi:hypothetical protein
MAPHSIAGKAKDGFHRNQLASGSGGYRARFCCTEADAPPTAVAGAPASVHNRRWPYRIKTVSLGQRLGTAYETTAMNDPDRSRQREHWQAIAEQLGLSPEPDEPSASQVSRDEPPSRPEYQRAAEPAAAPVEPVEPSEEEPPTRRGRRGRAMRAAEEATERAAPEKLPAEETEESEPAAGLVPPAEERASPKRGRRRRSARSSAGSEREAGETTSEVDSSGEIEVADQTAERPKRRGRGRGRQKKTGDATISPNAATDEGPGSKPPAPEEEEETEAEDVRSLTNWNVPSWNELIASLYRPER